MIELLKSMRLREVPTRSKKCRRYRMDTGLQIEYCRAVNSLDKNDITVILDKDWSKLYAHFFYEPNEKSLLLTFFTATKDAYPILHDLLRRFYEAGYKIIIPVTALGTYLAGDYRLGNKMIRIFQSYLSRYIPREDMRMEYNEAGAILIIEKTK